MMHKLQDANRFYLAATRDLSDYYDMMLRIAVTDVREEIIRMVACDEPLPAIRAIVHEATNGYWVDPARCRAAFPFASWDARECDDVLNAWSERDNAIDDIPWVDMMQAAFRFDVIRRLQPGRGDAFDA